MNLGSLGKNRVSASWEDHRSTSESGLPREVRLIVLSRSPICIADQWQISAGIYWAGRFAKCEIKETS
jgi:hypothetical protein